ncbi:hypothetical protein KCV07_g113, partial [Aureobasidium melanogenum]
MPLPDSRRPSLVSAVERPLPTSRAASTISAHQIALPESRAGSVIGSILGRRAPVYEGISAAGVPLPESRKTSIMTAYPASHLVTVVTSAMNLAIASAATTAGPENRAQARSIDHGRYMAKARDDLVDTQKRIVMLRSSHRGVVNIVLLVCLCMQEAELVLRRMRRGVKEVSLVLLSEDDKRDNERDSLGELGGAVFGEAKMSIGPRFL